MSKVDREIYMPIKNFKGYFISNLGNVKSRKQKRERILKPHRYYGEGEHYFVTLLDDNNKKINKVIFGLVFTHFVVIDGPVSLFRIEHINGDRSDNRVSNLYLRNSKFSKLKNELTTKI